MNYKTIDEANEAVIQKITEAEEKIRWKII